MDLDGILVLNKNEKSKYEKFFNWKPNYLCYLQTFGEVGIVWISKGQNFREKLANQGFQAIFVGYVPNHAGDVYCMYNHQMSRVITTRDVRFTGKYFVEIKKQNKTKTIKF